MVVECSQKATLEAIHSAVAETKASVLDLTKRLLIDNGTRSFQSRMIQVEDGLDSKVDSSDFKQLVSTVNQIHSIGCWFLGIIGSSAVLGVLVAVYEHVWKRV